MPELVIKIYYNISIKNLKYYQGKNKLRRIEQLFLYSFIAKMNGIREAILS